MASYSTTANVFVSINGKQAEKMMSTLKNDAQRLERQIAKAAAAGDKVSMQKFQRELNATKKMMDQLQGSSNNVENVLRRLDKATPKELNKTLRQLQQQLNGIQRGTAAWDAHVAKIQAVKNEIQRVNATMASQKTLWTRMNGWLNSCQTAILGIGAGITGLIMAGRKAVNQFAQMDEQLANTRKYTGLSADKVNQLNDAFKRMDTRTPREKLNELAQEAGRLGKNTLEGVRGYVEAADIINVALVDLGDGATQSIAKLTNIFGVEKLLGTKEAMLAVGSAVNVLSQNCTASKPYLVEFAQRMAGIGSQAGLTIPQILAFGAVLDANGQKVEMSATAIQKVIMNLANKNHEFAATLGLDAQKLNETLKRSAKDGLLMFLEALQQMGQSVGFENATMTLAPAFKEMGLDAARVSQVLSTLAMHLDEVRWQMGEADKAFKEASSATKEYEIFNNTAQAAIDKAKKKISELAIELGEKLYPVMKHIYTSSSLLLRVLNVLVNFIIEFRRPIAAAVVALGAYYSWLGLCKVASLSHAAATKAMTAANLAFNVITKTSTLLLSTFRVGAMAAVNAVNYFTNGLETNYAMQNRWTVSLTKAKSAWQAFSAAIKATPIGVLVSLGAALFLTIEKLTKKTEAWTESIKKNALAAGELDTETLKEIEHINDLFSILRVSKEETDEYNKAKNEVIKTYGKYIANLIDEKGKILDLTDAYNQLTYAIKRSNQEKNINVANQEATQEAYNNMTETLKKLKSSLLSWLDNDYDKVNTIMNQVSEALSQGTPLPKETVDLINSFSGQIKPNASFIDKVTYGVNSFFNRIPLVEMLVPDNADPNNWEKPADLINQLFDAKKLVEDLEGIKETQLRGINKYFDIDDDTLQEIKKFLVQEIHRASNGPNPVDFDEPVFPRLDSDFKTWVYDSSTTLEDAIKTLNEIDKELMYRGINSKSNNDEDITFDPTTIIIPPISDKNKTDKFQSEKDWKERQENQARIDRAADIYDEIQYRKKLDEIAVEYYKKLLEHQNLSNDERLKFTADLKEAELTLRNRFFAESIDTEEKRYFRNMSNLKQELIDERITQEDYDREIQNEKIRHFATLVQITKEGSKERNNAESDLQAELLAQHQWYNKKLEELEKKRAAFKKDFFGYNPEEAREKYLDDLNVLTYVYQQEVLAAQGNKKRLLEIEEAFLIAKKKLREKYKVNENGEKEETSSVDEAIKKIEDFFGDDNLGKILKTFSMLSQQLSAITSAYSSLVQAELDEQTRAIEKRYDAEISAAEGNAYRIAKLEKEREAELAKAKKEANRKLFAMQVFQAIAQTAQNAISAYGEGLKVGGLAGLILAPIASAMAIAAGGIQIAAIKKQQQAAESQGYKTGGFTPEGDADEVAGVVHKGEWVASQKLTKNPSTRPILEMLDYAQRNNAIGSIRMADVSRTISAPALIAAQSSAPTVINNFNNSSSFASDAKMAEVIERLNQRLDEPFVTVNTVTGDFGIEKAQSDYNKLMRNKAPKSKK